MAEFFPRQAGNAATHFPFCANRWSSKLPPTEAGVGAKLLLHLFAQKGKCVGGDFRLPHEDGHLLPAGVGLTLGVDPRNRR